MPSLVEPEVCRSDSQLNRKKVRSRPLYSLGKNTGPLSVPLFLFYGLTKGAFLATEAASSLGLYLSKSVTFQHFGALTPDVALKGLIAGSSLMFGAFIAKRFVLHLKPDVFRLLMDGIMLAAGISMLGNAFWN